MFGFVTSCPISQLLLDTTVGVLLNKCEFYLENPAIFYLFGSWFRMGIPAGNHVKYKKSLFLWAVLSIPFVFGEI